MTLHCGEKFHASDPFQEGLPILLAAGSFYDYQVPLHFKEVAVALEMAIKYSFNTIRQHALRRMSFFYPKDIASTVDTKHCIHLFPNQREETPCLLWDNPYNQDAPAVLHLALKHGLDDLLPMALYACATFMRLDQLTTFPYEGTPTLTHTEIITCVHAREFLWDQRRSLLQIFTRWVDSPQCLFSGYERKDHQCASAAQRRAFELVDKDIYWKMLDPASNFVPDAPQYPSSAPSLCEYCIEHTREAIFDLQQATWDTLRKQDWA